MNLVCFDVKQKVAILFRLGYLEESEALLDQEQKLRIVIDRKLSGYLTEIRSVNDQFFGTRHIGRD